MLTPSTRAALAAALLTAWGHAHAAVQFEAIPAATPHANITALGGVPVLPFDTAPQAAILDNTIGTTIPGVPSPATGSLTVAPGGMQKRTMPITWIAVWANGYTGPIFWSGDQTTLTLTLPPRTTAFHVFAQPYATTAHDITATTDSGATSGAVTVTSPLSPAISDIPGLGFYTTTPGEAIASITITVSGVDAGQGLAIARFGIAQAPDAPTAGSATPALGQATLSFTPPADTGTEPIDSYTASCTPQSGGAAITATGAASPIIVTGLTNGTTYDCTVAATSAAGTGPESAALSVTPQAAPVTAAAPTPVPTLGRAALALLGLLAAAFGWRRLRRG